MGLSELLLLSAHGGQQLHCTHLGLALALRSQDVGALAALCLSLQLHGLAHSHGRHDVPACEVGARAQKNELLPASDGGARSSANLRRAPPTTPSTVGG